MPYRVQGKTVVKVKPGGGTEVVGHSANPKKYKKMLQAIEHGFKPTGKGRKK